jgi:hypothetical protein
MNVLERKKLQLRKDGITVFFVRYVGESIRTAFVKSNGKSQISVVKNINVYINNNISKIENAFFLSINIQ